MASGLQSDGGQGTRRTTEEEEEEDDVMMEMQMEMEEVISEAQHSYVPASYSTNSAQETRLLDISDNFLRQYSLLCPDRKPLLLCPLNECGVRKFVSTTLRPTTTSHGQLLNWQGCASFVADFLSLEPLEPPSELPRQLSSSPSVLHSQRGTCFEFATLLCNLLLGINYDAYCVSGYAVREMCLLDQSQQQCPLLEAQNLQGEVAGQEQEDTYSTSPLREMKSHFLDRQEKKKQDAAAALLLEQKLKEEREQRPSDPLRGLRVHCWVLVLSGSRCIQENFFIDPLTGTRYPTDHASFLGIESVWNNFNYYVNMQDCRSSCSGMLYDLDDLEMWEPVLYGATNRKQLTHDVLDRKDSKMLSQVINEGEEQPRVFEMPRSWLRYVTISDKDLETRWPGGKKVIRYRKATLEKFAPCLNPDGLITRLTTYTDLDCTDVAMVKEWYKYRTDRLEEREVNTLENFTAEHFGYGRDFHLLFHRCRSLPAGTEREMQFSSSAHLSSLVRRQLSPHEMKEWFQGRNDFLHYRHVFFSPLGQPPELTHINPDLKILQVQKVVERFRRNKCKPANEDVAKREFLVPQRRFRLTYHLMDHRFIPSKRSFIKPLPGHQFTVNMVSTFQVDLSEKPLQTLTLYRILKDLMKDEEDVAFQVQESLKEVRDMVLCREKEEQQVELWTTAAAAVHAWKERQKREIMAAEGKKRLKEQEKDVLAPFLIRLGNPGALSHEDAKQLYQNCLSEFRNRQTEQINLLQQRYSKETEELQARQTWYQKSHRQLSQQQLEEYQSYCSEKTLTISAIQQRLIRQREMAEVKYSALDQKLQKHPRLVAHLSS